MVGRFSSTAYKGSNFCDFLFASPAQLVLSEKESTLKGKNLLPLGANSFVSEKTTFLQGAKAILKELAPLKMNLLPWMQCYFTEE